MLLINHYEGVTQSLFARVLPKALLSYITQNFKMKTFLQNWNKKKDRTKR